MVNFRPPTILTMYSFRSQSPPNLINSFLSPVEMYLYFITYPLILTTSLAVILNSPISSFCPLATTLVLTSDNFHSILPPLLPSSCPAPTLVALIRNCHMVLPLPCVHIHLLSSDRERHL